MNGNSKNHKSIYSDYSLNRSISLSNTTIKKRKSMRKKDKFLFENIRNKFQELRNEMNNDNYNEKDLINPICNQTYENFIENKRCEIQDRLIKQILSELLSNDSISYLLIHINHLHFDTAPKTTTRS